MRVLFVIDTLSYGGAERSLLEIARHLEYCDPIVLHLYRGSELGVGDWPFPIDSLELAGKRNEIEKTAPLVAARIRRYRPDIVNSTLRRSRFASRIATTITRTRHAETFVNDDYGAEYLATLSRREQARTRRVQMVDRFTAGAFDRGIAISKLVRQRVCADLRVPMSKIDVVPRGRDPGAFASHARDSVRRDLGIPVDAPLVISVGRLAPQKGHSTLIDAFAHVSRAHPSAHLVIAGTGPLRTQLEHQASAHDCAERIHLVGARSDVPRLLGASDVFALATRFEGLGGVFIEAMMSGLPLVASDLPVLRELITDDDNGLLATPGDVGAFANHLSSLLGSREMRQRIGARALQRSDRYAIDRIAREYRASLAAALA